MTPQSAFRNPQFKKDELILFVRDALGLPGSIPIKLSTFEGRGSNRAFFRLRWPQESVILIHYDPKRLENTFYADIAGFLHDIAVPTPRLIRHDPVQCLILMEDLGDTDLWSFRETPWETRRVLYEKTLTIVNRLHSFPEKDLPSVRLRLMGDFGPDLYRWERNYFMDHFVRDISASSLRPPLSVNSRRNFQPWHRGSQQRCAVSCTGISNRRT